jgi:hypothetical protein
MVFARVVIKRLKDHGKSAVIFQNLRNLYSLRKSNTLILEVKVLVEVERGVVDKVQPEIAGVVFCTELKRVVAYEFVVDVYLDE